MSFRRALEDDESSGDSDEDKRGSAKDTLKPGRFRNDWHEPALQTIPEWSFIGNPDLHKEDTFVVSTGTEFLGDEETSAHLRHRKAAALAKVNARHILDSWQQHRASSSQSSSSSSSITLPVPTMHRKKRHFIQGQGEASQSGVGEQIYFNWDRSMVSNHNRPAAVGKLYQAKRKRLQAKRKTLEGYGSKSAPNADVSRRHSSSAKRRIASHCKTTKQNDTRNDKHVFQEPKPPKEAFTSSANHKPLQTHSQDNRTKSHVPSLDGQTDSDKENKLTSFAHDTTTKSDTHTQPQTRWSKTDTGKPRNPDPSDGHIKSTKSVSFADTTSQSTSHQGLEEKTYLGIHHQKKSKPILDREVKATEQSPKKIETKSSPLDDKNTKTLKPKSTATDPNDGITTKLSSTQHETIDNFPTQTKGIQRSRDQTKGVQRSHHPHDNHLTGQRKRKGTTTSVTRDGDGDNLPLSTDSIPLLPSTTGSDITNKHTKGQAVTSSVGLESSNELIGSLSIGTSNKKNKKLPTTKRSTNQQRNSGREFAEKSNFNDRSKMERNDYSVNDKNPESKVSPSSTLGAVGKNDARVTSPKQRTCFPPNESQGQIKKTLTNSKHIKPKDNNNNNDKDDPEDKTVSQVSRSRDRSIPRDGGGQTGQRWDINDNDPARYPRHASCNNGAASSHGRQPESDINSRGKDSRSVKSMQNGGKSSGDDCNTVTSRGNGDPVVSVFNVPMGGSRYQNAGGSGEASDDRLNGGTRDKNDIRKIGVVGVERGIKSDSNSNNRVDEYDQDSLVVGCDGDADNKQDGVRGRQPISTLESVVVVGLDEKRVNYGVADERGDGLLPNSFAGNDAQNRAALVRLDCIANDDNGRVKAIEIACDSNLDHGDAGRSIPVIKSMVERSNVPGKSDPVQGNKDVIKNEDIIPDYVFNLDSEESSVFGDSFRSGTFSVLKLNGGFRENYVNYAGESGELLSRNILNETLSGAGSNNLQNSIHDLDGSFNSLRKTNHERISGVMNNSGEGIMAMEFTRNSNHISIPTKDYGRHFQSDKTKNLQAREELTKGQNGMIVYNAGVRNTDKSDKLALNENSVLAKTKINDVIFTKPVLVRPRTAGMSNNATDQVYNDGQYWPNISSDYERSVVDDIYEDDIKFINDDDDYYEVFGYNEETRKILEATQIFPIPNSVGHKKKKDFIKPSIKPTQHNFSHLDHVKTTDKRLGYRNSTFAIKSSDNSKSNGSFMTRKRSERIHRQENQSSNDTNESVAVNLSNEEKQTKSKDEVKDMVARSESDDFIYRDSHHSLSLNGKTLHKSNRQSGTKTLMKMESNPALSLSTQTSAFSTSSPKIPTGSSKNLNAVSSTFKSKTYIKNRKLTVDTLQEEINEKTKMKNTIYEEVHNGPRTDTEHQHSTTNQNLTKYKTFTKTRRRIQSEADADTRMFQPVQVKTIDNDLYVSPKNAGKTFVHSVSYKDPVVYAPYPPEFDHTSPEVGISRQTATFTKLPTTMSVKTKTDKPGPKLARINDKNPTEVRPGLVGQDQNAFQNKAELKHHNHHAHNNIAHASKLETFEEKSEKIKRKFSNDETSTNARLSQSFGGQGIKSTSNNFNSSHGENGAVLDTRLSQSFNGRGNKPVNVPLPTSKNRTNEDDPISKGAKVKVTNKTILAPLITGKEQPGSRITHVQMNDSLPLAKPRKLKPIIHHTSAQKQHQGVTSGL